MIMMYESTTKKPTKQKRLFHDFMERNKRGGVVGVKVIRKYIKKKGYKATYKYKFRDTRFSGYGKKTMNYQYEVKNKKGTVIADIGIKSKKSPRVTHWAVK